MSSMGVILSPLVDTDEDMMFNRFMAEEHEPGLRIFLLLLWNAFTLREKGFIVGTVVITVVVGLKSLTINKCQEM